MSVRKGPLRELVVDGVQLDPEEGTTPTIVLSGRSGPVHMSGNGTMYAESNPHPGRIEQDISVTAEVLKTLSDLQSSRRSVSVTVTTAGNEVLDGDMYIANDGGLEGDNGTVSLELSGRLRPR